MVVEVEQELALQIVQISVQATQRKLNPVKLEFVSFFSEQTRILRWALSFLKKNEPNNQMLNYFKLGTCFTSQTDVASRVYLPPGRKQAAITDIGLCQIDAGDTKKVGQYQTDKKNFSF